MWLSSGSPSSLLGMGSSPVSHLLCFRMGHGKGAVYVELQPEMLFQVPYRHYLTKSSYMSIFFHFAYEKVETPPG